MKGKEVFDFGDWIIFSDYRMVLFEFRRLNVFGKEWRLCEYWGRKNIL